MSTENGKAPGYRDIRFNTDWITRPLFGLLLAGAVLAAVGLGPDYFAVVLVIVSALAAREWHRLVRTAPVFTDAPFHKNPAHLQTIATVVVIALSMLAMREKFPLAALALIVIGAVAGYFIARSRGDNAVWQGIGVLYIGLPALALIALHTFPAFNAPHPQLVAGFFIIIWATDTGALIVGKIVGGRKLAPTISPGKTWSGTIGGSLCAGIAYEGYILLIGGTGTGAFIFAILFSIVAHCGDLFESFVKRRFGRKDSGSMIPGHGGVLDRVDSTFAAAPVMALLVLGFGFNPLMMGHL